MNELVLGRPHKTSHKPSKPPLTDHKERRDQAKPGSAELGHKGHCWGMNKDPDAVVEHRPDYYARCSGNLHGDLPAEVVGASEHIELPEVAPVVTLHRRLAVQCPSCGARAITLAPEAARGTPFGPQLHAIAKYITTFQTPSYARVQAAFSALFGLKLSQGGMINPLRRTHGYFNPSREAAVWVLRRAIVVVSDETKVRIKSFSVYHWLFHAADAVVHRATPILAGSKPLRSDPEAQGQNRPRPRSAARLPRPSQHGSADPQWLGALAASGRRAVQSHRRLSRDAGYRGRHPHWRRYRAPHRQNLLRHYPPTPSEPESCSDKRV